MLLRHPSHICTVACAQVHTHTHMRMHTDTCEIPGSHRLLTGVMDEGVKAAVDTGEMELSAWILL